MKTLLFTLEFPPFKGGIANYYGNLAKYWPIEEKLLVFSNNKKEIMRSRRPLAWLPAIWSLRRCLRREKIDYLLVGQILPLGTIVWLLALFRPLRYAVFLHGMDFAYALRTPHRSWLAQSILKKADTIICANSYVADQVNGFYPPLGEKLAVVNPGIVSEAPLVSEVGKEEIRKNFGLEGKTILFSLGRLVSRKGVDRTIEALMQVPESLLNNLVYFIAGTGPKEELLRSSVPDRLKSQVRFLGEISEDDKWLWLSLADIFIMPARDIAGDFEGFGIVYLEANLCGKPVIAGNSGGVKDAVQDGLNGLVVDSEKVDAIASAIITLASDKELRERLGQAGRARATSEFNWEKQIAKIADLIR